MKNLRWCCQKENTESCMSHEELDGCCAWICECGHKNLSHAMLWNGIHSSLSICTQCECTSFEFASNNGCTIECQFLRKVYEQK